MPNSAMVPKYPSDSKRIAPYPATFYVQQGKSSAELLRKDLNGMEVGELYTANLGDVHYGQALLWFRSYFGTHPFELPQREYAIMRNVDHSAISHRESYEGRAYLGSSQFKDYRSEHGNRGGQADRVGSMLVPDGFTPPHTLFGSAVRRGWTEAQAHKMLKKLTEQASKFEPRPVIKLGWPEDGEKVKIITNGRRVNQAQEATRAAPPIYPADISTASVPTSVPAAQAASVPKAAGATKKRKRGATKKAGRSLDRPESVTAAVLSGGRMTRAQTQARARANGATESQVTKSKSGTSAYECGAATQTTDDNDTFVQEVMPRTSSDTLVNSNASFTQDDVEDVQDTSYSPPTSQGSAVAAAEETCDGEEEAAAQPPTKRARPTAAAR